MKKIRLGIIGIGNMGSTHANNIKEGKCPDIDLVAVADIEPERLQWAKENLPDAKRFSTAEEMLDSGVVDSVLVAVPHYFHPEYAIKTMKRGIHVMVEKPAGVYTKQVREMNDVAKQCNVVFGMMFNQRTNHIYRNMREIVQSGKYGEIRRTNWIITNWYRSQAYYNSGSWRATWSGEGGGVLLNQCPHQLDLWQWICGMPVRVQSNLKYGKWHNIEVEDDVTTFVEYANGATGVFVTTTGDALGSNRFEIQLDKGKILAENDTLKFWEFDQKESEFTKVNESVWGAPKAEEVTIETDGLNEQHVGVLNSFAGAILRGEPLTAGGEEGINGLTLSNAMHLSSWLNKPIDIPFDEELYYNELMKRVATSQKKENVKSVFVTTNGSYNAGK